MSTSHSTTLSPNHDNAALDLAAAWLADARQLTVFTGAGVSAASGIPTFRQHDGLWDTFPPDVFGQWNTLREIGQREPQRLARFLHAVLDPITHALPNTSHRAIATLQDLLPTTVVTQNIDHLHQDAGQKDVHEIHGSVFRVMTEAGVPLRSLSRAQLRRMTRRLVNIERGPLKLARLLWTLRPWCGVSSLGPYRPNIVMFGETLSEPAWGEAQYQARHSDVMLVIGTSGLVYPAASLPELVQAHGGRVIRVDPAVPGIADLWLPMTARDALTGLLDRLL